MSEQASKIEKEHKEFELGFSFMILATLCIGILAAIDLASPESRLFPKRPDRIHAAARNIEEIAVGVRASPSGKFVEVSCAGDVRVYVPTQSFTVTVDDQIPLSVARFFFRAQSTVAEEIQSFTDGNLLTQWTRHWYRPSRGALAIPPSVTCDLHVSPRSTPSIWVR